jgi:predicted dehydrogenase
MPLVEIMKRIHNGDLGKITSGQACKLVTALKSWGPTSRKAEWSDMEWQIRRWLFHTWLSGDFIVEQHIHNLDLINWALNAHPVRCTGIGGRQARTDKIYGDVYDHMAVEYVYPDGVRIEYKGAQIDGINIRSDQRLFGTKGKAYFDFGRAVIEGHYPFDYGGEMPDPCLRQHADQIDAIRNGKPLNEAVRVAESTLTAIMGRMSAYTGKSLKWSWVMNVSKLDLRPAEYKFGDLPEPIVAIPGVTRLL